MLTLRLRFVFDYITTDLFNFTLFSSVAFTMLFLFCSSNRKEQVAQRDRHQD